ncbi:unnamed protein product [Euphydryas editha]|uniref:FLYWCH-type domain-containing protein n=1 Tax=Euphydryas editha TaxID=104508 RepID=A0AAU9TG90_EUPED|nr:unnamed protein product [Euphydryas editha]
MGEYGQIVTTVTGSTFYLLDGYTYSKNRQFPDGGIRYACRKRLSRKCGAFIRTSKNNIILKTNTFHNHEPPGYVFTKDGYFVKT